MAVRNGTTHDTEYEVQQPMPFADGTYLASTGQTVFSLALIIGGVVVGLYSVYAAVGTWLTVMALLAVLGGGVVEGYNLLSGSARAGTSEQLYIYTVVTGRIQLKVRQQVAQTFASNAIVVFYHPQGTAFAGNEDKRSVPIVNPNALVELTDAKVLVDGV